MWPKPQGRMGGFQMSSPARESSRFRLDDLNTNGSRLETDLLHGPHGDRTEPLQIIWSKPGNFDCQPGRSVWHRGAARITGRAESGIWGVRCIWDVWGDTLIDVDWEDQLRVHQIETDQGLTEVSSGRDTFIPRLLLGI